MKLRDLGTDGGRHIVESNDNRRVAQVNNVKRRHRRIAVALIGLACLAVLLAVSRTKSITIVPPASVDTVPKPATQAVGDTGETRSIVVTVDDAPFVEKSVVIGGKERGPSGSFITGDSFRLACDFIFDDTLKPLGTDPAAVVSNVAACRGSGETRRPHVSVFVQTHMLNAFLQLWLPLTKHCPIVVVTHNSDYSAPYDPSNTRMKEGRTSTYSRHREQVLENRDVMAWFAQNTAMEHPKLIPIPIGIENRYNKYGAHFDVYQSVGAKSQATASRRKLLFVSFSIKTNPRERNAAMKSATKLSIQQPQAVTLFSRPPPKKSPAEVYRSTLHSFLTEMAAHQFVLAPHGHGVDTHRLWEAMYVGCIPIVMRSAMDTKLLNHLPVLLVDSYDEVTAERLQSELTRLSMMFAEARRTLLNMSFWRDRVRSPNG